MRPLMVPSPTNPTVTLSLDMPSPSLQTDFPIGTVQASRVSGVAEDLAQQSAFLVASAGSRRLFQCELICTINIAPPSKTGKARCGLSKVYLFSISRPCYQG